MDDADFGSIIEKVARALWGDPVPSFSTKLSLRWGTNGARSVDLQQGVWFDHERGEGGGTLKLVMRETGADKDGAIEWLENEGLIEKRKKKGADVSAVPSRQGDARREESLPQGKRVMAGAYDYVSADGELLYQVTRWNIELPDGSLQRTKDGKGTWKTFLQRRPSRLGDNSWIWGLDAGEFMRAGPGRDWTSLDETRLAEWPRGERRWFDSDLVHTIYRHDEVEIAIAAGKPIFLPEGEKDAETFRAWHLVGTTNSGGAKHWTAKLAAIFKGADVVIPIDNDEVGRAAGQAKARSLKGIASRIRVLDFAAFDPSFPQKHDVTDWRDAGGTKEELLELVAKLPDWTPARPISRFTTVGIADTSKQKPHRWLVQDFIELGGTCSVAGFSQAGKTFLTTHLTFSIARGTQFFGRDVEKGLVVYQIGESESGFFKRIEGYKLDRGLGDGSGLPIELVPSKINLFSDDRDTDDFISLCKGFEDYHQIKLRLAIIDTWNKATRGANEVSGQDMGKVINNLERIAHECDCTAMVVDHLNKGGDLRGHGSKSMDLSNTIKVMELDREDNNRRKIRRAVLDKNKDGENRISVDFVLRQVVIGADEKGHPVSTMVVDEPDGDVSSELANGGLSVGPALFLQIIRDTAEIEGSKPPVELTSVPAGVSVARWTDVLGRMRKSWTFRETDPKRRDAEMARIVKDCGNKLKLAGYIDRDNERGLIWWTGKERKARTSTKPTDRPKPSELMTSSDMDVPF